MTERCNHLPYVMSMTIGYLMKSSKRCPLDPETRASAFTGTPSRMASLNQAAGTLSRFKTSNDGYEKVELIFRTILSDSD